LRIELGGRLGSAQSSKLVKLHGSISNWGTVVVTDEGYERCYRRLASDAMGGSFIDFVSGKRLVFLGYFMTDEDFAHIYDLVRQRFTDTPRRSYIVTLDERINSDTHPEANVILKGWTDARPPTSSRPIQDRGIPGSGPGREVDPGI
jgi:hypothetical protein